MVLLPFFVRVLRVKIRWLEVVVGVGGVMRVDLESSKPIEQHLFLVVNRVFLDILLDEQRVHTSSAVSEFPSSSFCQAIHKGQYRVSLYAFPSNSCPLLRSPPPSPVLEEHVVQL